MSKICQITLSADILDNETKPQETFHCADQELELETETESVPEAVSAEVPEMIEAVENLNELQIEEPETELDPSQVLEDAFLRACKTLPKKTEFPILTSNFFRTHVIPSLPPEYPNLDVKQTKWKKLSKFLSDKANEGFLTIKEQKKGVEVIASINQEHPTLINYRVVKYQQAPKEANKKDLDFEPPKIEEIYIVSGNDVALFFKECGLSKGQGLSPQDVRECVRSYVSKNQLQNSEDKSIVNLDPVLAQAVLVKGENNVVTFRWEKMTSRITGKMSKGYQIQFKDNEPPLLVKGKLENIEMTLGNRSGNKKVTLIHNLDVYGINPTEFAHKCQVGVAASSTVNEAANKKKQNGTPVIEVLVQGNQVAFAAKLLLEHYKIPKKYIKGLELGLKKGKK